MEQRAEHINFAPQRPHIIIQIIAPLVVETDFYLYMEVCQNAHLLFLCHLGVNYLRPNFATVFGLLFWFWGEGVGELLGYFGVGDSDDVCCGGGEAEEVDVAVPHN